jgi:hypothetical protein
VAAVGLGRGILPLPSEADMFFAAMGSHADDIVGDYFDAESWDALDDEPEPELELPPLPPAPPSQ